MEKYVPKQDDIPESPKRKSVLEQKMVEIASF